MCKIISTTNKNNNSYRYYYEKPKSVQKLNKMCIRDRCVYIILLRLFTEAVKLAINFPVSFTTRGMPLDVYKRQLLYNPPFLCTTYESIHDVADAHTIRTISFLAEANPFQKFSKATIRSLF